MNYLESHPYALAAAIVLGSCVITAAIAGLVYLLGIFAIPILIVAFILGLGYSEKKMREI